MVQTTAAPLISASDPAPIEVVNAKSASALLLLCEHAGRAIPAALGDLGVGPDVLNSHRGWDIGAEKVARGIAETFGAPLVIQPYSRLVVDCNRPPGAATSIPVVSDGCEIPRNRSASQSEKAARIREIFNPMDRQIADLFQRKERLATFSIHSFTPTMNGNYRAMQAGFLTRQSIGTAEALMRHIDGERPDMQLALNEPYQIDDETDWFIPKHAERRRLPHCLIEIRNDQVDDTDGVALWTGLLSRAIHAFMECLR